MTNPRGRATPIVSQQQIAESVHYRVIVQVVEVVGLPERKTRDMAHITTTSGSLHDALTRAKAYVDLELDHVPEPIKFDPVTPEEKAKIVDRLTSR